MVSVRTSGSGILIEPSFADAFLSEPQTTRQGDAATVQNMRQLIAALLCLETRFHPARLKVLGNKRC